MAAEAGQLQLNAMEPLIAYNVLESIRMLTQAMDMFRNRCVRGITANRERCQQLVDMSIGVITAVVPYIGYENTTRIAKSALETGRGVLELIREEELMSDEELNEVLKPANMIRPQRRRPGTASGV
jgi:aspartate ammonia-lyase